jgi:hypothetical protein
VLSAQSSVSTCNILPAMVGIPQRCFLMVIGFNIDGEFDCTDRG